MNIYINIFIYIYIYIYISVIYKTIPISPPLVLIPSPSLPYRIPRSDRVMVVLRYPDARSRLAHPDASWVSSAHHVPGAGCV